MHRGVFQSLLSYQLITSPAVIRTTIRTSAAARMVDSENMHLSYAIDEKFQSDEIFSLRELNGRFNSCHLKSSGFHQLRENDTVLYISQHKTSISQSFALSALIS